ncbi:MAG: DEAD/DEAH box helicase [Sandaracinus sp.]|nr:DEAD/DEAH box helicase [Sandaracinus sp.]
MADAQPEKGLLEKHLPPPGAPVDGDVLLEGFLAYAEERGLELYPAQEEAILELFAGKNVVLNTPTGSGKSLVALALHFKGLAEEKVSFYTAPIKALVNEKFFSLCKTLGPDNVGLMTGDATVNRDAPVVCATAEILSNLALREGSRADVDYVVMDEFHYYSDRDRGAAWQIPLLALPQARFLLMSATLGETQFFVEDLETQTGAEAALVKTRERPVPLDFEYRMTPIHETIGDLLEAGTVPIYVVHFTQRSASEHAQSLMSIDFLPKETKKAIKERMRGHRFDSPFGKELKRWLPHGVGVHHAGMLPKYRLLVEKLAQEGFLKIICGTDTLGVGVNIPIRTVLFTQLCKYDGEKTAVLTVRDFQQIAGRAGRKGFDDRGLVVCQAPAHVIENEQMRAKVGDNPKKLRKLKTKKPPDRGYAHWDEDTFRRLIDGEPERLVSRFEMSHAMILNLLARQDAEDAPPKAGCDAIRTLITRSHEARKHQFRHGRTAIQMIRSMVDANIVELGPWGARIVGDLQEDFSLNRALSLYVVEAIDVLDRESPEYALDVLSFVEATLENPGVVLRRQLHTLKGRALDEMKAEGMEYDERMAELEKIDIPKPKAELLYETFDVFRAHHPWVGTENVRPKSVARDLYELGYSFNEYVKEYGLRRSEGVLLRYLSNAYKAMVQNVPENAKTDEVYDLTEWLGGVVRGGDSSLLDEWERMRDPEAVLRFEDLVEEKDEPEDITRNARGFTVLIRNAVWRVVQALARKDGRRAAQLVSDPEEGEGWDAERFEAAMAPYWEEHERIFVDPVARSPKHTRVKQGDAVWEVQQTIADPADHLDWQLAFTVPLEASREAGAPVLVLESLGRL